MKESSQTRAQKLLKPYRKQIDALDDRILKALGTRFKVVNKVAKIKAKHGLPAYLPDRVEEVLQQSVKTGKKYGIDPAFVYNLYAAIIYESCSTETEIKATVKKKKKRAAVT